MTIFELLEKYNIPYWTEGKNTQPGWVNIQCPLCGDHSNHGGINYQHKYLSYNCWHCGKHRIGEVFQKLQIPFFEFENLIPVKNNFSIQKELKEKIPFVLPGTKTPEKYHIKYLENRGFTGSSLEHIINYYDIHFTNHLFPDYNFRIIFPIRYKQHGIVSFQGRSILNDPILRYKACQKKMEIINHKLLLYNYDHCFGTKVIVVEGIFDCIKFGDNCCCTFGTSYTLEQALLLSNFEEVFIIFDNDESGKLRGKLLAEQLEILGTEVTIIQLPIPDPGLLTKEEALTIKTKLNIF